MTWKWAAIAALLAACAPGDRAPSPAPSVASADAPEDTTPAPTLPGASVYQLAPTLSSQQDQQVSIDMYRGHPTVVAMFYATCPTACPMMIHDLRTMEDALPPEVRADLRVLLVTLDPETDTPERFRGVIERHQIDESRWTLTRSRPQDVREIAAALGIQYRRLTDGNFHHTSLLTLLDGGGVPRAAVEGGGEALVPFRAAVVAVHAAR